MPEEKTEEQKLLDAQEAAKAKPPEPKPAASAATPPPTGPFTITTSDGSTYTDETQEGLLKKVAQAKGDTGLSLRDRESQIRNLRSQPEPTKQPSSSSGLDQRGYLDMADTDFEGAVATAVERRLGLDKGELQPTFSRLQSSSDSYLTDKNIAGFYSRCKDYPGGKENGAKITDLLDNQNRDYTADHMESAYRELVREGQIVPLTEEKMKAIKAGQAPEISSGPTPPPDISAGGGGATPDPLQEILNSFPTMKTDEQRTFLMSKEYADYVARQGEKEG